MFTVDIGEHNDGTFASQFQTNSFHIGSGGSFHDNFTNLLKIIIILVNKQSEKKYLVINSD